MKKLYLQLSSYKEGYLKVSDLHRVRFEESGNPKGKLVIFLHGGPGSKIKPSYRRYFNPNKWRIVMFDQRGCGKSTPAGETKDNTTWDLIDDIERFEHILV